MKCKKLDFHKKVDGQKKKVDGQKKKSWRSAEILLILQADYIQIQNSGCRNQVLANANSLSLKILTFINQLKWIL